MRAFLLFTLFALGSSWAQLPFGAGLKGGFVNSQQTTAIVGLGGINEFSPNFTIGPYLHVKIPFLIGVETGVLVKRYTFAPGGSGSFLNLTNRLAYDVPVLAKKSIGPFPVKPFIGAGITFRKPGDLDWRRGFTLTGGVSVNALLIKVEPELRYTRFGNGAGIGGQNQVEALVGIRF